MRLLRLLVIAGLPLVVAPIQAAGSAASAPSVPAVAAQAPQLTASGTWSDTWDLKADVVVTSDSDGDALPAVDLVGGSGTFSYSSAATAEACEVISDGEETPPVPEAGACSISGHGSYTSIVCGTGALTGTINSIKEDQGLGSFSAVFVLGIGVLTGTFNEVGTADDPADGADSLLGVFVLGPSAPPSRPDDVLDCAEGFTAFVHITGTD
jgi:hypothetical protein